MICTYDMVHPAGYGTPQAAWQLKHNDLGGTLFPVAWALLTDNFSPVKKIEHRYPYFVTK